VVAHDLRAPLQTIRLACDVIEEATAPPTRQLEILRRATHKMQALIDDLVDAAAIRAARLSLSPDQFDPVRLLRECADDFAAEASERGITLTLALDVQSSPPVRGDARRVAQTLGNLIQNALKFTEAGGRVTLRVGTDTQHVRLVVEDLGRGIAPAEIDKVFDREWQSDETAHLGSGMGLYIAKGIAEAHGGTLTVTSELGHGSAFTLTLPFDRSAT